eukprot:TRINITY_DN986_c2_g2_i1.p1 TRINITY_DN986_c2_g2~~TRINITY_DN986_c2_g2_i1.p1  ORF type:complete len:229 (-),score=78.65 TRINITY_DN986_c2_g2_i1:34-672(-)
MATNNNNNGINATAAAATAKVTTTPTATATATTTTFNSTNSLTTTTTTTTTDTVNFIKSTVPTFVQNSPSSLNQQPIFFNQSQSQSQSQLQSQSQSQPQTQAQIQATSNIERRRKLFAKDIQMMMYGFGDEQNSCPQSIDLIISLVIEFIINLTHEATRVSKKKGKVRVEDFLFAIRHDKKKFSRALELLIMHEKIKRIKKKYKLKGEEEKN